MPDGRKGFGFNRIILHMEYCFLLLFIIFALSWGISSVGRALAWHARGHRFPACAGLSSKKREVEIIKN
jgi:hypothetical protein